MTSIAGFDIGVDLPSLNMAGIGWWITVACIILVFSLVGAIIIWLYYQNKIYNKKIIIFENVAGQGYQPSGKDKARIIKIGDGGEELLFLRRRKVYRSAYGRKMGTNTYWFAVGQDGYWYNILLGDLDAKMGMLDIEPIDRDMRYMHTAIRKNIQDRYRKEGIMQKYGTIILNSVFLIVMLIGMWLLMDKAAELINGAVPVANAMKDAVGPLENIYTRLDAICGASGYRPG